MRDADRTFQQAVAALHSRDLPGAEALFKRVLALDATHVAALNLLALVLMSLRRFPEAEAFIVQAIKLNPGSDASHYNYGLICRQLNKPQQALEQFGKALALNPAVPETWNNRGAVFNELKNYQAAVADFDRALSLNNKYAEAYANRGKALAELGRTEEALASYDSALSVRPDLAEAWLGRGNVLAKRNRDRDALPAYDRALTIKPDLPDAWLGRGYALAELDRYDEAFASYDRALLIKPEFAEAWLGRGNALTSLARHEEALAAYDKALSITPDLAEAWLGRGNVYSRLNRDREALACFDRAIALNKDNPEAQFNKALLKLSLAEFDEGWRLYESRWRTKRFTSPVRDFVQPLWLDGSDLANKTILVHAEQGLGDTIQFSRYLALLNAGNGRVVFEVPKALLPLFKDQRWPCSVIAQGDKAPPFDVHCPLMSLPLAFGTRIDSIPADIPYIAADRDKVAAWNARLGPQSHKPRIGVAWAGNPKFHRDRSRSIELARLAPLMNDAHEWYSLQKEIRERDRTVLNGQARLTDLAAELVDFSATAALIANLDLVISVDTAVAHLAGAMGKPVWVLLPFHPDFRWLRERSDSPWYPTARLYRQTRDGDWSDVLARVADDLATQVR